ncbi:aldolase catalytic domain-containing protein [Helicobacter burdigaliensis]|uniref:aldolase catalytic domain-containing protein n=1 Tax=Helicobacter burdigaliensis TaxID=2315334 RepID=UPI000EF68A28|nr:aldolase catalytic domain-containing protein [Helicobacter burdigaliensis]
MSQIKLLDCTLRDGGYIINWDFGDEVIVDIISKLSEARLDFIECGYLNASNYVPNKSIFTSIEQMANFLPTNRHTSKFLAMIDVAQFFPENITPYSGNSIDGLRIVFYKHQVKEALLLAKKSVEQGYQTFMQPMVTIDYTLHEYENLIREIVKFDPHCISIVDSFGYMNKQDNKRYFNIIDAIAPKNMMIGFHSHNNMDLAFICAQDVIDYDTNRILTIDSSLEGMGRCAGNLYTEIIVQYYNSVLGSKYDLEIILDVIGKYIEPIKKEKQWGYSPYFFITALYECHPNFATYLLELEPKISVSEFKQFVQLIPKDMKTKCKKPYVKELYDIFRIKNK